jgi:hypothetical protein
MAPTWRTGQGELPDIVRGTEMALGELKQHRDGAVPQRADWREAARDPDTLSPPAQPPAAGQKED